MKKPNIRTIKYIIPPNFDNRTLLDFLKSIGYSRNILNHIKKTTSIDVYKIVHTGETISIDIIEEESSENVVPIEMPLNIIYEDEDLIAINKPINMPTHPSKNNFENSLGNALAYYYKDTNFVYRPINRLDKDTSGVVLVAKNLLASQYLSSMMTTNHILKSYVGICSGNIFNILYKTGYPNKSNEEKDLSNLVNLSFEINLPISREEGPGIKRCVSPLDGEKATTRVYAISYDKKRDLSFCKFRLFTGRTHQIRVHMKHLGFPLIGDFLYNPDYNFIKRQALHCNEMVLLHPINATLLRFNAPLPLDMKNALKNY